MTEPKFDPVALKQNDPEKYWAFVEQLARTVPPDEAVERYKISLRAKAGLGITLESFEAYYELIHGNKILNQRINAFRRMRKVRYFSTSDFVDAVRPVRLTPPLPVSCWDTSQMGRD